MGRAKALSFAVRVRTPSGTEGTRVRYRIEYDPWARFPVGAGAAVALYLVHHSAGLQGSDALLWGGCAGDPSLAAPDFDGCEHGRIDASITGGRRRLANGNHCYVVGCVRCAS